MKKTVVKIVLTYIFVISIAVLMGLFTCGCGQNKEFASGNGWKSFYIYDQAGNLLYSGAVESFSRLYDGGIVIYDDQGNKYYTNDQNVVMLGDGSY